MTSNAEIDAPWFKMLYDEGYTVDEISELDCVWMEPGTIAEMIGVEYGIAKQA